MSSIFDYLGVRLNADKAEGKTMVINWNFTDSKQQFVMTLENSALTYVTGQAGTQRRCDRHACARHARRGDTRSRRRFPTR